LVLAGTKGFNSTGTFILAGAVLLFALLAGCGGDTGKDPVEGDRDTEDTPTEDTPVVEDLSGDHDDAVSGDPPPTPDTDAAASDGGGGDPPPGADADAVASDGGGGDPPPGADADAGEPTVENPWVAYVTSRDGLSQIAFTTADGSTTVELDSDFLLEDLPSWSNDGTMLAFSSFVTGGTALELTVLDFDARTTDVISAGLVSASAPSWGPTDEFIVVEGKGDGETSSRLYVVDLGGGGRLLSTSTNGDGTPVWAQSTGIVYFQRQQGDVGSATFDIFSIDGDGGDTHRVTTGSGLVGRFGLTHDESRLVYPTGEEPRLFSIPVGGGEGVLVGATGDTEPSFFPDGVRMAVVRQSGDDKDIAVVNVSGGALIRFLTDDTVGNSSPAVGSVESDDVDIEGFFE
jgi:Tol biopolymer transport system component